MSIIDGGNAFSQYDEAKGVGYSPSSRTVLEVRRAVQRAFGDESGVQIEDADILTWVNDAQDEIVSRNKVLKGTSNVTSIAGQGEYTFPTAMIHQVESLHYDGSRLPNMTFAAAEDQVISKGSSLSSQGQPVLWYEWGGRFSLWPVPAEPKRMTLYYTLRPTRVTKNDDLLSVPDKYYQNVVNYALQKAYEMDEDWQGSQVKQAQFEASIANMGEEERTATHMTYPVITLVD